MTDETLMAVTRLLREVRSACWMEQPTQTKAFEMAFARSLETLAGEDTRAAAWVRYCCETLHALVQAHSPAVYDFADAVHNAATLDGLADGFLWLSEGFWEAEIEPLRERYGQAYFAAFAKDVLPNAAKKPIEMQIHLRRPKVQ